MQIKVDQAFKHHQIEKAAALLIKFVGEDAFWQALAEHFYDQGIIDDLIQHETDIRKHLDFMFRKANIFVKIVPYRTRNPFSSVLGHAEGNLVHENLWKKDSLTLAARVGHLGHEITHLFGYSHEVQGDRKSATVRFGEAMEKYAEKRLKELGIA